MRILKCEEKLPNMISIDDQGWDSNILLRTMAAMNSHKNKPKKIMDKLCELFNFVYR